eukprot:Skav214226  [mRNA]  locus=scaffold3778:51372:58580:- [translate_table: standard]
MKTWGQRHGLGKAKANLAAPIGKGEEHALNFREFMQSLTADPQTFVKNIEKCRAKKDLKAQEQDRAERVVCKVRSTNSDGEELKTIFNTDAAFLRHTTPMPVAATWSRKISGDSALRSKSVVDSTGLHSKTLTETTSTKTLLEARVEFAELLGQEIQGRC